MLDLGSRHGIIAYARLLAGYEIRIPGSKFILKDFGFRLLWKR